jgi:hypothetical protein
MHPALTAGRTHFDNAPIGEIFAAREGGNRHLYKGVKQTLQAVRQLTRVESRSGPSTPRGRRWTRYIKALS